VKFRLNGAYIGEGRMEFRRGDAGIALDLDRDHTLYIIINKDNSLSFKLWDSTGLVQKLLAEATDLSGMDLIEFLNFDKEEELSGEEQEAANKAGIEAANTPY